MIKFIFDGLSERGITEGCEFACCLKLNSKVGRLYYGYQFWHKFSIFLYRIIKKLVSNSAKMENQRHKTDEVVKIFDLFIASNSVVATQRMFKKYYKVKRTPSRKCIMNVVCRFRERGTICSQDRTGRPKSARRLILDVTSFRRRVISRRHSDPLTKTH